MAKKKKAKKGKHQQSNGLQLNRLSSSAAQAGTALATALVSGAAQSAIGKAARKGLGENQPDQLRQRLRDAANAVRTAADAVLAVLEDVDSEFAGATKAVKDKTEDIQDSAGKVVEGAVDKFKDAASSAKSSINHLRDES